MNCQDATTRFSDLHDGRLSGVERAELEAHLTVCPACRQEWARFRETIGALHGLGGVEPRPGFAARVREQTERPPWFRRLARWLVIPWKVKLPLEAAALILLTVGTVVIYRRSPDLQQIVERPGPQQPPVSIEREQQDAVREAPSSVKDAYRAEPAKRSAPLAGGVRAAPAGEVTRQAEADRDTQIGAVVGKPPSSEERSAVAPAPPPAGAAADRRDDLQPSTPPAQFEAQPAPPPLSEKSARLLEAPPPPQAPQPFRLMTLRTSDVAVAEERIREWVQQAGGRVLDASSAGGPTGSGQRTFSVVIPTRAVAAFDALLAELGQLFGKELEVPPSREVLISLTISPKTRFPAKTE